jgi:DNA-binding transcriptional MerR regulator
MGGGLDVLERTSAAGGNVPPKHHYRIGEVAALVGVETHVLRYWEREFHGIRPTKSAKGQRVYSRRDVELLMRVHELLYKEGFTIAGAKKKLRAKSEDLESPAAGDGSAPAPGAVAKAREELVAMRAEIEQFLAELGPDG